MVLIVNSSNCEHFSVKVPFLYRKVKIDKKDFTRANIELFSIIQCYFGLPDIYSTQNFNFDGKVSRRLLSTNSNFKRAFRFSVAKFAYFLSKNAEF